LLKTEDKKRKRTAMSSKHRRDSSQKRKQEEGKSDETNKRVKIKDESEDYPTPPFLEEQCPDDLPRQVDQDEPEDDWYCEHCDNSPCAFVQWQEELEGIVEAMDPGASNKSKRFHLYQHLSHRLHGCLGKGNRRPLPLCLGQGMRDLYPSEAYTGYKPSPLAGDSK
jgi:hypothetical protein